MLQARSWLPRTEGTVRLAFARGAGRTALTRLHQAGAARARFPNPVDAGTPEAVLLNTAGGLTGGDRIDIDVALGADAEAAVTTAAAEKVYRARDSEAASINVKLALEANARLAWLPQPTILFDQARLDRRTEVSLAENARLLAAEMLIFGRAAMGEDVRRGACRDVWRVRRGGKLVFADTFLVDGPVAEVLDRPAALDGARAVAMLLYVAPDAAAHLEQARGLLADMRSTAGASTWNGLLLVRAYAEDGRTLQDDLKRLIERFNGRALPRVWQC